MAQGTFSDPSWIVGFIEGDSIEAGISGAVIVGQYLKLWGGAPYDGKIGGIMANARTAGSGAGNTVLDVLLNGTTIWPINAGNRPTLASASTGGFTVAAPPEIKTFKKGDTIDIQVASIPATAGHRDVSCIVTLEKAHGGAINE